MKLLSVIGGCMLTTLAWAEPIIVFDAGSTGTRLYLYDVNDAGTKPVVTPIKNVKTSPAITDPSFAANPTAYDAYFNGLFKQVEGLLTVEQKAQTPIYFYATAGLRMSSQEEQARIVEDVSVALNKAAGNYQYPVALSENIRAISVDEESFFIWVNDNDTAGKFDSSFSADQLWGAIEMGGASAEISYLAPTALKHALPFEHQGHTYTTYATGYDGYGQDQGLIRMRDAYLQNGGSFEACFPAGSQYPLNDPNPIVKGTGNFAECQAFITTNTVNTVDKSICESQFGQNCSSLGEYQPPKTTEQYLLTSGFYYTFKVHGLADKKFTSLTELDAASAQFCATPWETLKQKHPGESEAYLNNYCFNSAFMDVFLRAVHVADTDQLYVIDKYEGQSMSWTRGVAYTK